MNNEYVLKVKAIDDIEAELNDWETNFISNMINNETYYFSERQKKIIDNLIEKYKILWG
jgi:hypothetical protein